MMCWTSWMPCASRDSLVLSGRRRISSLCSAVRAYNSEVMSPERRTEARIQSLDEALVTTRL